MKDTTKILLGMAGAMLGGAGVGYFVADKILETKYREELQGEIEKARVFYQNLYSREDIVLEAETPAVEEKHLDEEVVPDLVDAEPKRIVQEAVAAAKKYEGDDEEPKDTNIFSNPVPPGSAVLDALLADRDIEKPYIITKEEYLANADEYEQFAFTWFEGDSVLIKDNDEYDPIDKVDEVAGDDNLLHFGYGSEDPEVVYIRNEVANPPFDLYVTRSQGKYTNEVLGMDEADRSPYLQHSQRRFRLHDD